MAERELLPNVVGMDVADLAELFAGLGEPRYRARQVLDWVYGKAVYSFDQMTNLSKALQSKLSAIARIALPQVVTVQVADDGTSKYLLELDDHECVEAVIIPEGERLTACLSSQVGCGAGCAFCATGLGGLVRNLTTAEIIGQLLTLQETAGVRLTNVVMMGMGEPLANYPNVIHALRLMNDPAALAMGARRFTVSTSGIVPGIRKLASESLQVNLAVSLHAPDDELRDRLVPINRKYPLTALMPACREYIDTTGRRITFEYVLLQGVNDTPQKAHALGELLRGLLCHVNLIPVNPVAETGFRRPDEEGTADFARIVKCYGVEVTMRKEKGAGIDAACGQLRVRQMR